MKLYTRYVSCERLRSIVVQRWSVRLDIESSLVQDSLETQSYVLEQGA